VSLALVISARDNVATALEALEPGQTVRAGDVHITVAEPIPRGHKVALHAIAAGEPVVKYGSAIGIATSVISAGAHVHVHNVASTRGRGDLGSRKPDEHRAERQS
jgi:SAF domain-containing protein